MSVPIIAILDEVKALLAAVAPSSEGGKALPAHDAPPRFVWIVSGADTTGTSSPGGNPRPLHDDQWALEVHCWGQTLEQALLLRQGLVTAMRQVVRGANYAVGATTLITNSEHLDHGHVAVVPLRVRTPLVEARLPELGNRLRLTVRPTQVDIDTSTILANAADGVLDAPNEA